MNNSTLSKEICENVSSKLGGDFTNNSIILVQLWELWI